MRTIPLVLTIAVLAIPVCASAQTSSDRSSPVIENYFEVPCRPSVGLDSSAQRLYTGCGNAAAINVFDTGGHFISQIPVTPCSDLGNGFKTTGLVVDWTEHRLFPVR